MARTERDMEIVNKLGLHARPAMQFVETAKKFESAICIHKDDLAVDGKNIMEMMMLAAMAGTHLRVCADGPDAEEALDALAEIVKDGFGEEI